MTIPTLLLMSCLSLAQAEAAPRERLLAAVPEDAFLVAFTDEWDALRERASDNRWVAFFQDEQWRPVWDALCEDERVRPLLEGDVDLPSALATVHGRVAVFAAGPDAERSSVGLLVEPGEDRAAFEELYDGVVERMAEEREPGYGDYRDVELAFFEDEEGGTQVHFELEGLFVQIWSATSETAVETSHGLIDRYRGDAGEGFAANATLGRASEGLPTRPAFWGFADVQRLTELVLAESDTELEPEEREMLEAVGLSRIGWAYAQAELGEDERLALRTRVDIPPESLLGDLLARLGPLPTHLLARMPSGVTSVSLWNYDLWGAYQVVKAFLAEHASELHMQLEGGLTMMKASMQIDLEADLLSRLSGIMGTFEMPVPLEEARTMNPFLDEEAEASSQGMVFLVGLESTERVEALVSKALQLAQQDALVETKEYQGRPFFELPFPAGPRLHWAFSDGMLVAGMFATPLRAVLARSGDGDVTSARDDAAFAARIDALRASSMAQVADTATSVAASLEALPLLAQLDETFAELLGEVPLPDPEIAREYFSGTVESSIGRRGNALEIVYAAH